MRRYFSDTKHRRFISDFQFLFRLIRNSHGELDLRLRDGYFNLYYRGNSMMAIYPRSSDYRVSIHKKFTRGVFEDVDARLEPIIDGAREDTKGYINYNVRPSMLHPFLQRQHLNRIQTRIKRVNHGEETTFEHALITDNQDREDYFIIDRQVRDPGTRYQMDLLGLRQAAGCSYEFEVIEVKMGNNPELAGRVAEQLNTYVNHVQSNAEEWAASYEKTYQQLRSTRIFEIPHYERIVIEPRVSGRIVVMGYSGLARPPVRTLEASYPGIRVQQMSHKLSVP